MSKKRIDDTDLDYFNGKREDEFEFDERVQLFEIETEDSDLSYEEKTKIIKDMEKEEP